MNLKDKQKKKNGTPFLRSFYSEMIKLFGGPWLCLYLRPRVHRISSDVPKRIKGGALIAANHTSMLDPLVLFCVFWYRRLYFPATKQLFEKPINRFFFYNMNCIRIDKDSANIGALKHMCGLLKKERVIGIFPEGGINNTEDILSYKSGTAYMALKSGKPVFPVYIANRENRKQPTHVILGEPVDVTAICDGLPRSERIACVSEYLRDAELRLEEYYNTKIKV